MTVSPKNSGWIEVICGPMFSGKTEELIRRLVRAQFAKQKVAIFKPKTDKRKIKSIILDSSEKIKDYKDKADVFGVDEAQFFDKNLIGICNDLAKSGKRVVIAGLDKDFSAKSFGPIANLMVDAEYVTKVNAICMVCGDPASFTQRMSKEKDLVVVGETDKYEARCRKCFQL
jgi:thymidine kinase